MKSPSLAPRAPLLCNSYCHACSWKEGRKEGRVSLSIVIMVSVHNLQMNVHLVSLLRFQDFESSFDEVQTISTVQIKLVKSHPLQLSLIAVFMNMWAIVSCRVNQETFEDGTFCLMIDQADQTKKCWRSDTSEWNLKSNCQGCYWRLIVSTEE